MYLLSRGIPIYERTEHHSPITTSRDRLSSRKKYLQHGKPRRTTSAYIVALVIEQQ